MRSLGSWLRGICDEECVKSFWTSAPRLSIENYKKPTILNEYVFEFRYDREPISCVGVYPKSHFIGSKFPAGRGI